MKRIAVVFGTRPEFIKLAPLLLAARNFNDLELIPYSTGQHQALLEGMFDLFEVQSTEKLNVDNKTPNLSDLTANILTRLEQSTIKPGQIDGLIVQGDTTSTLTAALYAFYNKIPVFHVEAGLRTQDRFSPFPEEVNRRLVSRIADLHFCPTDDSRANLIHEGFDSKTVFVTGNTVIDALHFVTENKIGQTYSSQELLNESPELYKIIGESNGKPIVLVTMHRRENQGDTLTGVFNAFKQLALEFPDVQFVYPVHMNPNVVGPARQILADVTNFHLIHPLSYRPFIYLMFRSCLAITDSGGVQEEYPSTGNPVLVLRRETERGEIIAAKLGKLVGIEPDSIVSEVRTALNAILSERLPYWFQSGSNPYGDGKSSQRILNQIRSFFKLNTVVPFVKEESKSESVNI
jgi:UDP-N-acetylglucosamine 2-epimerase (non-hydrolysing)